ncbi:putative C6 transcription factor [Polychaeton citri CBS 116435]|uniref:C6 transcription factor n=1 Tax=Polychaeton citri CBS 116435 TaxID=1314669 RepID=A0A9P4Q606_9PEZI|nr:putative C6 transcription factor [Polychaeton citri CBS 116435]
MNQRSHHSGEDNDSEDDNEDDDYASSLHKDLREVAVKMAMDHTYESNEHLLFGSRKGNHDLSASHPEQLQVFRLWQVYLDNVNPLLKVTHTPTLQVRIINAASNVADIPPPLEALMFSIYCVSIMTLTEDDCQKMFSHSRKDLLTHYQVKCQQGLHNCKVLRSGDRDCLTALFLYLVAIRPDTDPRSLSSMLGVAIRIAQHMGLHSETMNTKSNVFEAEMRRRLWWSLVTFDSRICEMCGYKTEILLPTWDCHIPLNVNDFDIRPEMKSLPTSLGTPTEAFFAVVRSVVGDYIRHSSIHLEFVNPALKALVKRSQGNLTLEDNELKVLESTMEQEYLESCNPENPLHFMTIWSTRSYLTKCRLLEYYAKCAKSSTPRTDAQRDAAVAYALSMLECDTKLLTSPLVEGYSWLVQFYFPFPAYLHMLQDLKMRPNEKHAEKAWQIINSNYEARFKDVEMNGNPLLQMLSKIVLHAWEARKTAPSPSGDSLEVPRIVLEIKRHVKQEGANLQHQRTEQSDRAMGMSIDDALMLMPIDFGGQNLTYSIDGQAAAGSGSWSYPNMPVQPSMDVDLDEWDWSTLDWNPVNIQSW